MFNVVLTPVPFSGGNFKKSLAKQILFWFDFFFFFFFCSGSLTVFCAIIESPPNFEWLFPFILIVKNSQSLWQQLLSFLCKYRICIHCISVGLATAVYNSHCVDPCSTEPFL